MKKILIIPLLFLTLIASGTKYYVKTGGNDASAGTSDATAWANHPWMSTWGGGVTLQAGDTVCMNRGDTWSINNPVAPYLTIGQSGSSGNYIVTTAYGTGDKPLIKIATDSNYPVIRGSGKGFLIFDNLDVQHNSSTFYDGSDHKSGFDLLAFCHDIIIQNCEISNCPEFAIHGNDNCYNIVIGDTTATATATTTNYSNYIHSFGYAGVGLEGTNEAGTFSNHKVYYNYITGSTRTSPGDNAYGIYFSTSGTSITTPINAYARFNMVTDIITWECIDTHGGTNIYFEDNYCKNFGFVGILLGGQNNNIYCQRNIVHQDEGWVAGYEGSFIVCNSTSTNVYIRDNICFYTARPASGLFNGIVMQNTTSGEITGNKIYNGSTASGLPVMYIGASSGGNITNVRVANNFIRQWGDGILIRSEDVTGVLTVENNIVLDGNGTYGCLRIMSAFNAAADIRIYNNTLASAVSNSYVIRVGGSDIPAGASIKIKNNIMCSLGSGSYYIYWIGTITGTFECDYNLYWGGTQFRWDGGNRNWAAWQGYGFDLNSPNTTISLSPQFKIFNNYDKPTGVDIKTTSPAINTGTNVGLTHDYFGFKILGSPDIGAIQARSRRLMKLGI